MEKESKIYVAGHRGLVGSAIWKSLQSKGYSNLVGASHSELDLIDSKAVASFFDKEKPEYVVVASAKVGGIQANSVYRAQFIYENLMIACNTIHQSYTHGVKKLLFLGSSCIYPRMAPQPMPEDCLLTSPLEYTNEPYAISKIAGIKMCESYNLQYGSDFLSLMPTNLYGPNDNFNLETSHVLPAILRKVHLCKCLYDKTGNEIRKDLNRRPIEGVNGEFSMEEILMVLNKYGVRKGEVELWGTGTPLREFLWSEDMADACVYVMENITFKDLYSKGEKEIRNTHINVGSGKEVTIAQTAEFIRKTVGFEGQIIYNADKPDGTPRKLLDSSRLNSLGWVPKVDLADGISRFYDWYQKN